MARSIFRSLERTQNRRRAVVADRLREKTTTQKSTETSETTPLPAASTTFDDFKKVLRAKTDVEKSKQKKVHYLFIYYFRCVARLIYLLIFIFRGLLWYTRRSIDALRRASALWRSPSARPPLCRSCSTTSRRIMVAAVGAVTSSSTTGSRGPFPCRTFFAICRSSKGEIRRRN